MRAFLASPRSIVASVALLAVLALFTGVDVSAQKEFMLEGIVDCGRPSGARCDIGTSVRVRTADVSGENETVVVDVSWVTDQLDRYDQDDLICLDVRMQPDGTLQAIGVSTTCGTPDPRRRPTKEKDERVAAASAATETPTSGPTSTATLTATTTLTPTSTPTGTLTPSATPTLTLTPTSTATSTATPTSTSTRTPEPTNIPQAPTPVPPPPDCSLSPSLLGPRSGSGVVYSAIPNGVLQCPRIPGLGYEANFVNEFGDEVGLTSTSTTLNSLTVVFASFGCSVSGHWFTPSAPCVSTPGATFSHPITANFYAVDTSSGTPRPGALLATVTQTQTIAFRPSSDPLLCPSTAITPAGWFNPASGACQNSIAQLLTFNFPAGTTLPSQVIWTIAFNTTNAGYSPIGPTACSSSPPGCGYDSLNVGVFSFSGSPYIGTDVDPNGTFLNSVSGDTYCDNGAGGTGTLRLDTPCWTNFRPLGEVRLN